MQSDFYSRTPATRTPAISLEEEFRHVAERSRRRSGRCRGWLEHLLDFLTGKEAVSIRHRQVVNETGEFTNQWIAYDPYSDSRCVFDSEQALRAWLEHRHLQ